MRRFARRAPAWPARRAVFAAAGACAAALLLACAGSGGGARGEGEWIEAEGWAPLDPADASASLARALAQAQRKAVEQVVGVYISAKSRVSQAASLDQNILARVEGYVRKYKVLGERKEEGFHKVRIRALVLYGKLGQDLSRLGLTKPPAPGNPRIVVLVQDEPPFSESREGRAASAARRSLLERGYAVVDRNDPVEYAGKKGTDTATALDVARRLGADIVVRGSASAYPLPDPRLGGFYSYRARVVLEAMKGDGYVLGAQSREASALDPAPEMAAAKALENAGMLAAEALASSLTQALGSKTQVGVLVSGFSGFAELERFVEDLRLVPEVSAVTLAGYAREGTQLAVTTEGMAGEDLAAHILRMKRYAFLVRSVTPYAIELGVETKP